MRSPRGKDRGGVLLAVVVFVVVIALLASVLARVIFARAIVHEQARRETQFQRVAEGVFWKFQACVEDAWEGEQGALEKAAQDCAASLTEAAAGRESFAAKVTLSGDGPPYSVRVALDKKPRSP